MFSGASVQDRAHRVNVSTFAAEKPADVLLMAADSDFDNVIADTVVCQANPLRVVY